MPSVTLTRHFYPNISGWPKSLGSHSHNSTRISSRILRNGPQHIGVTTSTCLCHVTFPSRDHLTSSVTWLFDSTGAISYTCSIATETRSPAIFEIMGILYIRVTTFTFLGHVMSSVMWPIDAPYVISYWCPIWTESVSWTVFEIFASKYIWITTWPFNVTWRHRSRDHLIQQVHFL